MDSSIERPIPTQKKVGVWFEALGADDVISIFRNSRFMMSSLFLETWSCSHHLYFLERLELMMSYHYEMVTSFQFPYIRVLLTFNHKSLLRLFLKKMTTLEQIRQEMEKDIFYYDDYLEAAVMLNDFKDCGFDETT